MIVNIEEIREPIKVVAAFPANGEVIPLFFLWRNRRYKNLKIAASWSDYEGEAKRIHFSIVTDKANLYELCFHTRKFQWKLEKIYHG